MTLSESTVMTILPRVLRNPFARAARFFLFFEKPAESGSRSARPGGVSPTRSTTSDTFTARFGVLPVPNRKSRDP